MRSFWLHCLSFLLLMPVATGTLQAFWAGDTSQEYCLSDCYECRCEPLYECSWGAQLHAGIRPIIWKDRDALFTVNCLSSTALNDSGQLPKFSSLYHVPWQIGFQVSYATSCNTNLFLEFNWARARAKDPNHTLGSSNLLLSVNTYKLYDGYFGARYYFNRWCNRASIFLGAKLGFVHYASVQGSFAPTGNGVLCYPDYQAFDYRLLRKNTAFAGGGQIGLDICLTGNWALVVTAEIVVNGTAKRAEALALSPFDSLILNDASALVIPSFANELAFPITCGIKYNF